MISDLPVVFSLLLSLFLLTYSIRSIVFLYTAKKTAEQKGLLVYDFWNITRKNNYYLDKCLSSEDIGRKYHTKNHLQRKNPLVTGPWKKENKGINPVRYPFVSILIATYNEALVIHRLMRSCTSLTYSQDSYEIIVVDDSQDGTFYELKNIWTYRIPNLKVIHREKRTGWKGGALNLAVKNMNDNSSYALVVDADNILVNDILEQFVLRFSSPDTNSNDYPWVVQGYPISYVNSDNDMLRNLTNASWIARAIDFRLTLRNLIENLAKNSLKLPVQITGSLFMIRADIIKKIGFSDDICEDWDLTLDLNFPPKNSLLQDHKAYTPDERNIRKIIFDPFLLSYSEAITKVRTYLKQRKRVSEGHTRGFRRRIILILNSNISILNKIEFLFTGLQYLKFAVIFVLIVIDVIIFLTSVTSIEQIINGNQLIKLSLTMQSVNLLSALATIFFAMPLCRSIRNYTVNDAFYLLLLNIWTLPVLVLGSLLAFVRTQGFFYKVERNK